MARGFPVERKRKLGLTLTDHAVSFSQMFATPQTLRDLYRKNHRLYLRYAVVNHSGAGYIPIRPVAWFLEGSRSAVPHSGWRTSTR
jgi:hypothetical protein